MGRLAMQDGDQALPGQPSLPPLRSRLVPVHHLHGQGTLDCQLLLSAVAF